MLQCLFHCNECRYLEAFPLVEGWAKLFIVQFRRPQFAHTGEGGKHGAPDPDTLGVIAGGHHSQPILGGQEQLELRLQPVDEPWQRDARDSLVN